MVARTVDETVIERDPATSFWLLEQIKTTRQRDILDALADAEALVDILRQRWMAIID
jgi:hypothetical protein